MIRPPPISPLFPSPPLSRSVLAVDNRPSRAAADVVESLTADARVRYLHEPRPGVSHARNTGLADRKSTRLNSSHLVISYAVFCLKKKKTHARCPRESIINRY